MAKDKEPTTLKEAIEDIVNKLIEANTPAYFIVFRSEMTRLRILQQIMRIATSDKDKLYAYAKCEELLAEIWKECRPMTAIEHDLIHAGIERISKEDEEQKASEADEWINCY